MSSTRGTGIALAFVTALISGVAIFVNGHVQDNIHDIDSSFAGSEALRRMNGSTRSRSTRAARPCFFVWFMPEPVLAVGYGLK